ncbi:MAG: hypothetical protein RR135_01510 [Oscillospiraceae bacterium]
MVRSNVCWACRPSQGAGEAAFGRDAAARAIPLPTVPDSSPMRLGVVVEDQSPYILPLFAVMTRGGRQEKGLFSHHSF